MVDYGPQGQSKALQRRVSVQPCHPLCRSAVGFSGYYKWKLRKLPEEGWKIASVYLYV